MKVSGIAKNFANGRGISKAEIEFLFAEVSRLESLAAQHLADQELLVGRERKRVAKECIDIIKGADTEKDAEAYLCGYVFAGNVIQRIRARYGVEE